MRPIVQCLISNAEESPLSEKYILSSWQYHNDVDRCTNLHPRNQARRHEWNLQRMASEEHLLLPEFRVNI